MSELPALDWRTAASSAGNQACVQVAALPDGGAAVRNSREPDEAPLRFTRAEMRAFIAGVKAGEFDDLT